MIGVSCATSHTMAHTYQDRQELLCCRYLVSHKPLQLLRGQDPSLALGSPSWLCLSPSGTGTMLCLAQGLAQRRLSSVLLHTVPSELTQLQSQTLYFLAPQGASGLCVHVFWLDKIIVV